MIVVHIAAVWLCLCLSGCKTSHTISRAELHRTSEHVAKSDSLATHTAVSDSTVRNIAVTDSTVITHIIETIITNTVDAAGNLLDTRQETNRTTNRDHNRTVNDQTNNRHNEQNGTTSRSNLESIVAQIDSTSDNEVIHDGTHLRPWYQIILDALLDALAKLAVLAFITMGICLIYKYIKGK